MSSSETGGNFGAQDRPLPKVIYDEALQDPSLPYNITVDAQAYADLFREFGLSDDKIADQTIMIRRRPKIGTGHIARYNRGTKRTTLFADRLWEVANRIEKKGGVETPEQSIQSTALHEAKHAIDLYSKKEILKSAVGNIIGIGGPNLMWVLLSHRRPEFNAVWLSSQIAYTFFLYPMVLRHAIDPAERKAVRFQSLAKDEGRSLLIRMTPRI